MEQNTFRKADNRSRGQQISRVFCNPEAHYHTHKIQPLRNILSQFNLISILYIFNTNFHVLLPPCFGSRSSFINWCLRLKFCTFLLYLSALYMPLSFHTSQTHVEFNILWDDMLCSQIQVDRC